MVDVNPDRGPRDVSMSMCVSQRFADAIRARANRTGESRSELLHGLFDEGRVQELMENEAAMRVSRRTFSLPGRMGSG